jgi:hypothetical protein
MSFAAIAIGGAVVSGAGVVGGIASRAQANKQIRNQLKNRPMPQISNLARTQLNARMPGAEQQERNIYQSGANAMGRTQQAATSAADVMQAAAGIQSQTNNAMAALGLQEAGDYQRRYGNLVNEQQYNQAQKMQDFETVNSAQAAIAQNRAKSWGDATQFGMGLASAALGGAGTNPTTGKSNLMGKGGGVNQANAVSNMSKIGYPTANMPSNMGLVPGALNPFALRNMGNMGNGGIMGNYGQMGMLQNANNPYYYQQQALMYPQQYPGGYE